MTEIAEAKRVSPGVWSYRGWTVTKDEFGSGWTAIGPDYDADWEGEERGFVDNGHKVTAGSMTDCCDEVDAWIEEHKTPSEVVE